MSRVVLHSESTDDESVVRSNNISFKSIVGQQSTMLNALAQTQARVKSATEATQALESRLQNTVTNLTTAVTLMQQLEMQIYTVKWTYHSARSYTNDAGQVKTIPAGGLQDWQTRAASIRDKAYAYEDYDYMKRYKQMAAEAGLDEDDSTDEETKNLSITVEQACADCYTACQSCQQCQGCVSEDTAEGR